MRSRTVICTVPAVIAPPAKDCTVEYSHPHRWPLVRLSPTVVSTRQPNPRERSSPGRGGTLLRDVTGCGWAYLTQFHASTSYAVGCRRKHPDHPSALARSDCGVLYLRIAREVDGTLDIVVLRPSNVWVWPVTRPNAIIRYRPASASTIDLASRGRPLQKEDNRRATAEAGRHAGMRVVGCRAVRQHVAQRIGNSGAGRCGTTGVQSGEARSLPPRRPEASAECAEDVRFAASAGVERSVCCAPRD